MGAINYKTSKYITIGYNCNNIDYDDEYYFDDIEDCFNDIKALLEQENFNIFNVDILPGYYKRIVK